MRSPFVCMLLAALMLLQGLPGTMSWSRHAPTGRACCRTKAHTCCRLDHGSRALGEHARAKLPAGACTLDAGACGRAPAATVAPAAFPGLAVRSVAIARPQQTRVASVAPHRAPEPRTAAPPLPPPRG